VILVYLDIQNIINTTHPSLYIFGRVEASAKAFRIESESLWKQSQDKIDSLEESLRLVTAEASEYKSSFENNSKKLSHSGIIGCIQRISSYSHIKTFLILKSTL
jgi:hypothetical protein